MNRPPKSPQNERKLMREFKKAFDVACKRKFKSASLLLTFDVDDEVIRAPWSRPRLPFPDRLELSRLCLRLGC